MYCVANNKRKKKEKGRGYFFKISFITLSSLFASVFLIFLQKGLVHSSTFTLSIFPAKIFISAKILYIRKYKKKIVDLINLYKSKYSDQKKKTMDSISKPCMEFS